MSHPGARRLSVAQTLLLLALDPLTGKVRLPSARSDAALGGAVLIDLVMLGRLELVGTGRRARVAVADTTPLDDPDLEAAFARVRQRGHQRPASLVPRLGRKQRAATLAALERRAVVRDQHRTRLGIPLERFELVDAARRDDLVGRVRQVLLQGQPADDVTGPLVGLLAATGLVTLVVDKHDVRRARKRAEEVSEGDWASEGVRRAIRDAQAALVSVAAAGAAAGGASSS